MSEEKDYSRGNIPAIRKKIQSMADKGKQQLSSKIRKVIKEL